MDTTTSLLEINPVLIMPATVYLCGPLIDAHPLILTSLLYMEPSLGELGMTCANLSIDMQLYMVGQQVQWYIGYGLTPESGDPPGGLLWGYVSTTSHLAHT